MDMDILKLILLSCENDSKDLLTSEEFLNLEKYEYFPLSGTLSVALSDSFTNLLCYKVSQQLHHRHTIQMQIVESLQLCSKIEDVFGLLDSHFKNIKVASTAIQILKTYLTLQRLNSSSLKTLIYLYNLILKLVHLDDELRTYLNNIIVVIAKHPSVDESREFVENIIHNQSHLDRRTIESIYIYHTKNLIEKPIIDDFSNYVDYTETADKSEFKFESCIKLLFGNIDKFSSVFSTACVILKEIFVKLDFPEVVLDFTKLFLNEVKKNCDLQFLNLYPPRLQSCVCLMKIEPHFHCLKSVKQLKEFTKAFSLDNDDLLILLMHFPAWLEILSSEIAIPVRENDHLNETMEF